MNRTFVLGAVVLAVSTGVASAQKPEAVALKKQGDAHLAHGAPDKAVAAYNRAIKADPNYEGAHGALASHYLRGRKYNDAVKTLRAALARIPGYAEGWYNLAYALRKKGDLDGAIGAYRHFAQLRPDSADPHYGIGLALQAKGDLKGAAQSFRKYAQLERKPGKKVWVEKARRLARDLEKKAGVEKGTTKTDKKPPAPKAPPVDGNKRLDATLAPTDSHTKESTPVTPQRERAMKFKAAGDRLLRAGRHAAAVKSYRQAVKVDYSYTTAYNELGTALFALKRYDQAIRIFRIAIRDNPDYHLGWYNLAYALRKAGRLLPAIAAYNKFTQARPKDSDPYFGLGLAYKATGNKTEAVRAFKRYVALERRQTQEKWVHKARVEIAKLEGREPPAYVPGKVIAAASPTPPKAKRPLTRAERRLLAREEKKRKRAEAKRKRADARKARLEAARLAREEKKRKRAEARQKRAEARKARLAAARLAREEKKRKRVEARRQRAERKKARMDAARLAREEKKRGRLAKTSTSPPPPVVPAAPTVSLAGVDPAPDVIVSPPMPAPPGPPPASASGGARVQGDTLARAGKFRQSAAAYGRAIRSDPFNTMAYDGMAYCAFKLGAYRQGARRLSIGIRDNPNYHDGWLHLARLHRAGKAAVKAVGSYRKYLAAHPHNVGIRLELARTLKGLGMTDQAIQEYRAVLRPKKLAGNEPVVVAARTELRGLGVTPPALSAPARATGVTAVTTTPPKKTPAQLRAEARRAKREAMKLSREERKRKLAEARAKAAEARRLAREERKRKLVERRAAAAEKRRKAAADRRARLEARRLARAERRRALKEKRLRAAEKRRLAREARRRRKGKRAPGTDLARRVGEDMTGAPPVLPRRRMHDVLRPAPEAASGLVRVADDQFAKKRYVVALGIYRQAAKLDPGGSEPLYKAGVTAVALGRMHLAADLFTEVLRIDPGNGTAKVNYEMARAAARSAKPGAEYMLGAIGEVKQAIKQGRYAVAERQSTSLLTRNVSTELHLLRGEARLAQRKPRQALADGGRALALDPGASAALQVMGDAHRQLGHRHKAIYYYRLFLSRIASDPNTKDRRAQIQQVISDLSAGK